MWKRVSLALGLAVGVATLAFAGMKHGHDGHTFEMDKAVLGDLTIETPLIRATPPAARAAGGYITITNAGDTDDTLTAARIDAAVAAKLELHTMEMDGDVMRMFEVEGGIPVPAGETVTLAPGGLHIMLMGLTAGMEDGAHHDITLTFANAGEVTLEFAVMEFTAIKEILGGGMGHGGHGDHGSDHSGHDH